jgi:hypothetical protein
MHEMANQEDCTPAPQYDAAVCGFNTNAADQLSCIPLDGCGSNASYVYFASFSILVTFVFVNLFVAVIIEAFADTPSYDADLDAEAIEDAEAAAAGSTGYNADLNTRAHAGGFDDDDQQAAFSRAWVTYDPALTFTIRQPNLLLLIAILPRPHGLGLVGTAKGVVDVGGGGAAEQGAAGGARTRMSIRPCQSLPDEDWQWPRGGRAKALARLHELHEVGLTPATTYQFEDVSLALGHLGLLGSKKPATKKPTPDALVTGVSLNTTTI